MKFAELYQSNKQAVKDTLTAMWCSNPRTKEQKDYAEQIQTLIDNELFTSENYVPLVQCMDRYESVTPEDQKKAENLVGGLWEKSIAPGNYPPYEHQYQAWKALTTNTDGAKQSMVVTTGTGSGKTECFMLPLVNDLINHNKEVSQSKIEAIFLYPLNALMEDQKTRLQTLLTDTNLRFAVYNGNLPTQDPGKDSTKESDRRLHERIVAERDNFPNIVATRKEMYADAPNIMLTNPTMLEYMLLRNKDQALFTPGSLKWIVIDETHTFSGAGAAELSMLIRRVLDAFGVEAKDVRFATSSATIGNAKTEEEEKENEEKLRQFISDITGVCKEQIKLITGKRIEPKESNNEEKNHCQKELSNNDYVPLNELFKEGSIEDKLKKLDELCEGDNPLKAKAHFFYRVPNNGFKVQLNDSKDGVFNIKTFTPLNEEKTPYLELFRCEQCGEYIAVAEEFPKESSKYRALTNSDSDIFSFDSTDNSSNKMIFGLTKESSLEDNKDGNIFVNIDGDVCTTKDSNNKEQNNNWQIKCNVQKSCPHCGTQLIGKASNEKEKNEDEGGSDELNSSVRSFRLPATFISRILAPSILPHLKISDNTENKPHKGQQYISFVDSRQAAARSTLDQNIEEEKLWVYSRVTHELNRRKLEEEEIDREQKEKLAKLETIRDQRIEAGEETLTVYTDFINASQRLNTETQKKHLTWMEIFNYLKSLPECEQLCYLFANKSEEGSEMDAKDGERVKDSVIEKYIHMVMIEQLAKRPGIAAAPETMGLFTTYYPKLEKIEELPDAVTTFNTQYLKDKKQIDVQEWKNFLKIFIDTRVRSDQSVYIKTDQNPAIDIFSCQRFGTSKSSRKTVHKPTIKEEKGGNYSKHIKFLAKLIEPQSTNLNQTAFENRKAINNVLDAMWIQLTDGIGLIQKSERLDSNNWVFDHDKGNVNAQQYRLNVVDIAFKLYDQACLCDTRLKGKKTETLRPIDTLFMGYSPYLVGEEPIKPKIEMESWKPYPFVEGKNEDKEITIKEIHEWAKENRKLLWNNELWSDNGCFSNRLNAIYQYPEIFVQAEHTAQVDKLVARQSQDRFKDQLINILACSTTMEMGVDLGNLELVMMSSIPPHPSNYKQRAGRSGRNDASRSACITLCGSDAIGLRTLEAPMEQLIKRPMAVPFVDLSSPQVIQRHVNAFLFRSSGIYNNNQNGNDNNLDQEVIEFFTPYFFSADEGVHIHNFNIKDNEDNNIYVNSKLGDENQTKYFKFKTFLNGDNEEQISPDSLIKLLRNTCFDGDVSPSIDRCKNDIERCYNELLAVVSSIAEAYELERQRCIEIDIENNNQNNNRIVIGDKVRSPYGYYLHHKYAEVLSKNLINYFATSRFTPNANMPIGIIEFNKNLRYENPANFSFSKSHNPSYTLQDAIAQYAPGNTIVLENRTSIVRGVLYTDMYKQTATFKQIYTDGTDAVIDSQNLTLKGNQIRWSVNNQKALTLVEPVAFIPDINEDYSRTVDKNPYSQVSAQLIGAGEWLEIDNASSLITMRNNRDCGNAQILYYNEGIGYGYAFCPDCGKTVLETSVAHRFQFPTEMQNESRMDRNGIEHPYHYKINRKNGGAKLRCEFADRIKRNIILGGLIQTDYCEIKIQNSKHGFWLFERNEETDKLLITLGILITKSFVEYIGKDRKDVDFTIMPNAHLCIFDTNPGGSGYSNQLSNQLILQEILEQCQANLEKANSKDALLDKFTIRYLDKLDIERAKQWLDDAINAFKAVPESIKEKYPDAKVAYAENIFAEFANANVNDNKALFVNSDWDKWMYQSENSNEIEFGWKQRIQDIRKKANEPKVNIIGGKNIPLPIYNTLKSMSDWSTIHSATNKMPDGLFPIAHVNGSLYFTDQKEALDLNNNWARNSIYRIAYPDNEGNLYTDNGEIDIDINNAPTTSKKFTISKDNNREIGSNSEKNNRKIRSNELGKLVEDELRTNTAEGIDTLIDQFVAHCHNNNNSELKITYQDEHLKSVLGMVTTLQFIEYYIKKLDRTSFILRFENKEYWDAANLEVWKNLKSSSLRNDILKELTKDWIEQNSFNAEEPLIETITKGNLPHWRELKFECAGKSLIFYPNGGLINEWLLDGETASRVAGKFYKNENTTTRDSVPLKQRGDIMYDIEFKDA